MLGDEGWMRWVVGGMVGSNLFRDLRFRGNGLSIQGGVNLWGHGAGFGRLYGYVR